MTDPQDDQTVPATDEQNVEQLLEELARAKDMAARAQADLQNAKARAAKEGEEMRKFATEHVVQSILPTLDNFVRAFAQMPEELQKNEWVKGVSVIEQDLMKRMSDVGLKRMSSLGEIVDPNKHEVLSIGPGEQDKVAEVFEEGYALNGKVLRPAKVRAGDGSVN